MKKSLYIMLIGLFSLLKATGGDTVKLNWPPGVDEHTIALWLFDEPNYFWMTLTDASPNKFDLRLTKFGEIVEGGGKYGNALNANRVSSGVEMAGPTDQLYRHHNKRTDFLLMAQEVWTKSRTPDALDLGWYDWSIEFWYKQTSPQINRGIVYTLGNVNTLYLDKGGENFLIYSLKLGETKIPTDKAKISDGEWHHIAFSYLVKDRQLMHFVDGILQPLPSKGGFLPMRGEAGTFTIGNHLDMDRPSEPLTAYLDEMRFSNIARYTSDFPLPGSFSNNYSAIAPRQSVPTGLPLLFEDPDAKGPFDLGTRKHVFIDDILLSKQHNVAFVTNVPQIKEITDFKTDKPWDPTPRFNNGLPDINSVWDDGERIGLYYYNGGFWGGWKSANCIAWSEDGLHWEKPNIGTQYWTGGFGSNPGNGTLNNNIVWLDPSQGTMFKDPNPNAPESERYKYLGWFMQRGLYLMVSPDGFHWRRNETITLPFEPGGGVEAYWDDQRGQYTIYLRCEGLLADWENNIDFRNREVALAESQNVTFPWNFTKIPNPKRRMTWDLFTLPSVTKELPIKIAPPDDPGQVYRSRAIKYPGAPDTYVAFAWRYFKEENIRPGCELMVSRDGRNWKGRGAPYYITTWNIDGLPEMQEALSIQGLFVRDDEIWQYNETRFTSHAGENYGGHFSEVAIHDFLYRTRQRLDGFVSIDADKKGGSIITKPIIFSGSELELNANVSGEVRVAILNENGGEISGFGIKDCIPVKEDGLRTKVLWKAEKSLKKLAGQVVRLKFELYNAKLYAFQFTEN